MLEVAASLASELPDGHEASIAATFARSIKQLGEVGLDFLLLASRVSLDPIPAGLVVSVFADADDLDKDRARERAVAGMRQAAERSLADDAMDGSARRVHTLISRTITLLEPASARAIALADSAIDVLTTQLGASFSGGVSLDASTLAHGRHLAAELREPRQATLLHQVAYHDGLRGDYYLACTEQERVVAAMGRLVGGEHPGTLTAMNNLAEKIKAVGDHAGARELHEQTLTVRRRVLGNEDPRHAELVEQNR